MLIQQVQKDEVQGMNACTAHVLTHGQVARNRTRVAEIIKFVKAEEDVVQKISDDLADA